MRTTRIFTGLALLCCSIAAGQNADKYVTTTASKAVNLPPGESFYQLSLTSDFTTPLEQIVTPLQELGVSVDNLVGIGTQPGPRPDQARLSYQFRFSVPFASIRETAVKLDKVRRSLENIDLQFYASGVSPTTAALEEARQRVLPELIAEARSKAGSLAAAGQVSLGDIESISENISSYAPTGVIVGGPLVPIGPPGQLTFFFTVSVKFEVK